MLQPSEGSYELAVTIVRCAALSVASVRSNPATERGVVSRQSSSNAFWCAVPMALGTAGASAGFCRTLQRGLGCAAPKDRVCLLKRVQARVCTNQPYPKHEHLGRNHQKAAVVAAQQAVD